MIQRIVKAILLALLVGGAAWAFQTLRFAMAIFLGLCGAVVLITLATPHIGVRMLDHVILMLRTLHWREQQGRHHAFGGVPLHIEDDGRHMWIAGADLQRALGSQDPEDVLAARHAGRWRRSESGLLLLRVDAVVDNLSTAPGRLDPRIQHLRRYFEREVLFPAAERRRRAGTA